MDSSKSNELDILKLMSQLNAFGFLKETIELGVESEEEIIKKIGLSPDEVLEIKSLLNVDVLDPNFINISKLNEKITTVQKELERKVGVTLSNIAIYVIYDWRKALKVRWPGVYRSEPVRVVTKSRVIFLSVLEVKWKDVANRDCVGIFGSGIYSSEFVPTHSDSPIEHYVPINGILLTKNLLNEIFSSPPKVVGSGSSVHRELISRIVLGEILLNPKLKTQTINLFMSMGLKGKLDVLEFLNTIREDALEKKKKEKLVFLSALPEFYNKLIVSKEKFKELIDEDIKGEPGIVGYEGVLERLKDLYKAISLEEISKEIVYGVKKALRWSWNELVNLYK